MQFMSQSMGWADHVILAMAPLGIITAIVSAIRVGGPSLLKAVIGRARENLAVAEAELMSSTSHEVCELWNGKEVVRCMGEAKICEFICLYPAAQQNSQKDNQTHESDRVPNFKTMKLDAAETRTYLDKVGEYLDNIRPSISLLRSDEFLTSFLFQSRVSKRT